MSDSEPLFHSEEVENGSESGNGDPVTVAQDGAPAVKKARTRIQRKFPALTFEESLPLAEAIQKHAAGQKVRRLTLFEKLDKSPDSGPTRNLITASGQYGLTKGAYSADFLELTPEGKAATSEDASTSQRLSARFALAIRNIPAFNSLYELLKGNKLPAKEVMADTLADADIPPQHRDECVDTFTLNAKYLGLLRVIAGSERLIPIEQAIEGLPPEQGEKSAPALSPEPKDAIEIQHAIGSDVADQKGTIDFTKICFFVTPIGDSDSEGRRHADFMMEFIIRPALREFDLAVVRADQMGQPGMIGRQVVEHILKSRLVIADLSFHNPNVFYELCLRHTTRLPTVQIKREVDRLPFDLNQSRTISIDTSDVYRLYPKLQTHVAEVATQVRRSLEDIESADNPISLYYPKAKLTWD